MSSLPVPVQSARTEKLKRLINQTFELSELSALSGLSDQLNSMGHRSLAASLDQLIKSEADLNKSP